MRRLLVAAAICLLSAGSASAASTILTPTPLQHFVDNTGFACYNCQLFTYAAGTDTKLATFTDSTGNTPNTDPIILNARGEASVWLAAGVFYKFVLAPNGSSDPPTNPFWTVDNISALGGGGLFPSFFEAPAGPTYDLSGTDNGAVIVSSGASAGLALVLPSTTTISSGWTIAIDPSTGHPVSLTVNGSSGGNIITDTGASVTALNNLGNQRIQIQFDGTNFQFATNRKTVIDPRDFGCALDGVTDDTVCFLSAINFAAALVPYDVVFRNGTPVVDCGGRKVFVSATEVIVNATGLAIRHCSFIANPAIDWADNFPLGMIDAEDTNNDRNIDISDNFFNGSNVAGGVTMKGHGEAFTFDNNGSIHIPSAVFSGHVDEASGNILAQWAPTDPQYCVTADYTAVGFAISGEGDGKYNNNTVAEMGIPFELGLSTDTRSSAPGATIGNKFEGNHPWVGANTGTCSPQIVFNNPVNILINPGSTGNTFQDTYDDNGVIRLLETKNNTFINTYFVYTPSKTLLNGRFDLVAQIPGDSFEGEIDPPSGNVASSVLLLVVCDGTGGNFWTIAPSICGTQTGSTHTSTTIDTLSANVLNLGWHPGMNVADSDADVPVDTTISSIASNGLSMTISNAATGSHTGDTIYVGNMLNKTRNTIGYESGWIGVTDSVNIARHFACTEGFCGIGFDGTFSGQVESTISQNNGNNLQFGVKDNAQALLLDAWGNAEFPGAATPTCPLCGSSAAIVGSNNIGHVTLAGASSPFVIVFAVPADQSTGFSAVPTCIVNQGADPSAITHTVATTTTLTVTDTDLTNGNVVGWFCF